MEDKQVQEIPIDDIWQEITDCKDIMAESDRPIAIGISLGLGLARDIIDKHLGRGIDDKSNL